MSDRAVEPAEGGILAGEVVPSAHGVAPRGLDRASRVFVAGHRGLLGRALVRRLEAAGFVHVLTADRSALDLTDGPAVRAWFERERPEYVLLAAARVGGIVANQRHPIDFLTTNLAIELAVLGASDAVGVRGLVLFGSSCMYPREAPQPMREDALYGGPLEPTSQAYAVSKLAGLELCRAHRREHGRRFFAMVPATLYGPHDHFGMERAHVIPALMTRFRAARVEGAKSVTVLGSGRPLREFLHCDDAADAALFLLGCGEELDLINAGSGEEVSIAELAREIATVVGFEGEIRFDASAPDGAPRKRLDSSALRALGWKPAIALSDGLRGAHQWHEQWLASNESRARANTQ